MRAEHMATEVEQAEVLTTVHHELEAGQIGDAAAHHTLRSVQDGRKALRRATLALTFSAISATGAWTNFTVTLVRALHHH